MLVNKGNNMLVVVAVFWQSASGVLLRGDDAMESSSEQAAMNAISEVDLSDTVSESTCPSINGQIKKQTNSEYLREMAFSDVKSVASSDVASQQTGHTRHEMEKLMLEDMENIDEGSSYEGESLLVAVEMNDAQAVQRILDLPNTDVNLVDQNGKTPLHIAAEQGCLEIAQMISVNAGVNINMKDKNNATALRLACLENHAGVVELILDNPKISESDISETMLACAYYNCDLQLIDLFLKNIKDVHTVGGVTLQACCVSGNIQVVNKLLQKNEIDVNHTVSSDDASPLRQACQSGHLIVVQKLLQHRNINVNKASNNGLSPLFQACQNGHLEIVEELLGRKELEVNKATTDDGTTPLFVACEEGHLEVVEKLLERNEIEVNKAQNNGCGPLFMACQEGNLDIVEKLLERSEIEVSKAKTDTGSTPLYMACQNGHLEIVEKLLERNEIEVNKARTDTGSTPLYTACQGGHLQIVEKLLHRSEIEVNKLPTPLFAACAKGHLEIAEKLLEQDGIHVNKGKNQGGTPLFVASVRGHLPVVQKLLEQTGIDVNKKNSILNLNERVTALEGALVFEQDAVAELLRIHTVQPDTIMQQWESDQAEGSQSVQESEVQLDIDSLPSTKVPKAGCHIQ